MNIRPEIAEGAEEAAGWRRELHRHPELLYDVQWTAAFVAEKLKAFGCDEVVEGIGKTGVVGVIEGKAPAGDGKSIGLRADMDALPIHELNDFGHKSTIDGKMHACGHDGHTTMLLAAARHLAAKRDFAGKVAVIFQPAEEGGAGGLAMVEDGMMERFGIAQVYGMHNMPTLPVGSFALRPGTLMAAADFFEIEIEGVGGHAAHPHDCLDPIVVGASIVSAAQTLVSRECDPLDSAVISICAFHSGEAHNVIPPAATLKGTARALTEETRTRNERRLGELCESIAKAHGARAKLSYQRLYPATVNDAEQTRFCAEVAGKVSGEGKVDSDTAPVMGGEDFSFMLNARPGAFIFIGNGDSAGLHHPRYDFNDEIIPIGASYWVALTESALHAA